MKKVLVVDDSRTVRQEVRAALAPCGFEVFEAEDGIDGKAKISEMGDLSMIICDVNMPRLNGVDMLFELKKEHGGQPAPVLMMTTEGSATMIKRAQEAGARAWIVKPFRTEQLVAAVKRLTEPAVAKTA